MLSIYHNIFTIIFHINYLVPISILLHGMMMLNASILVNPFCCRLTDIRRYILKILHTQKLESALLRILICTKSSYRNHSWTYVRARIIIIPCPTFARRLKPLRGLNNDILDEW